MPVYQPSAFLTRVAVLRVNPSRMGGCTIRVFLQFSELGVSKLIKNNQLLGDGRRENQNERNSPFFLKSGLRARFPVWSGACQRHQVLSNR